MKPEKACRIIGACAILHNIAMLLREPLEQNDDDNDDQIVPVPAFNGQQDGRAVRDHIATSFF